MMKAKTPNNPTKHPKDNNPKQDKTKPLQAPATKLDVFSTSFRLSARISAHHPCIYAPARSQDYPLFFTSQSPPATFQSNICTPQPPFPLRRVLAIVNC